VATRFVCACVLAVLAAGTGLLQGARGYVVGGQPWPGGVIRYYNAAADQSWAVRRAVDTWNASGAAVRFVAVPASRAQVRIEHFPRVSCTINAEATVGYSSRARIYIFRRDERSPYCNSYMAAQALAHELGHVLGLGHETRGCSLMNPVATPEGPALCPQSKPWQWRCRMLTSDDVAGAVALYGGTARPQSGVRNCDLYAGIRAPTGVEVRATPETHGYQISFRRPAPIPIPAFLSSRPAEPESFVTAVTSGRCATDPHAFGRVVWNVKPGEPQRERVRLGPGTYCVAVWAVDSFTRPSPQPARLWIRIV
jgi:Matrixin